MKNTNIKSFAKKLNKQQLLKDLVKKNLKGGGEKCPPPYGFADKCPPPYGL